MIIALAQLALTAVGVAMAIVWVRLVRSKKRSAWQTAWLVFAALLTLHPGIYTMQFLVAGVSFWFRDSQAAHETFGWAMIGLLLWIPPIAGTYVLGYLIAWLLRRLRRN